MSDNIKKTQDPKEFFFTNKIYPDKGLGQNFLKDRNAVNRIADLAELSTDDSVIEVGPGLGALTGVLADRAGRVIAIEKDRKIFPYLRGIFSGNKIVELIRQDALEVDFGDYFLGRKMKFAANLPYSVSTPILFKLLESRDLFSCMVLMLQLEVGERIVAGPGTKKYGSISVLLQTYMDISLEFRLSPGAFWPKPKVDSVVLKFVPLPEPRVQITDHKLFEKVVRASFSTRRKMLGNSLKSLLTKDSLDRVFDICRIDKKRRAETLDLGEFGLLAEAIAGLKITE